MSGEKEADEMKSESNEHMNVTVKGQDGGVVHFKIKRNTPLRKLMNAYCERSSVAASSVRFMFDGSPISETETPSSLEMEDNDCIDVFQQQTGGYLP
ncbi:small ubiquitin-related modifier 2-like [Liolophura sinensis]|uniref:small ubiquitin-related modifier 2-like n=1 Tax=Liolophura sinensis TaxID=3198878 RepID=UPI0031594E40